MSADPSTEVARAAMTRALALGAARAFKVNGMPLVRASVPAPGAVRPGLLDGVQPEGWGNPREAEVTLLGSRGCTDYISREIVTAHDSPYLGWEDSWTE